MVSRVRRYLVVAFLLALAGVPVLCYGDDTQWEALRMQMSGVSFGKHQDGYLSMKERDRHNVPSYNARLNAALIDFHKHIADDHYLFTTCAICRRYLREISSYSKKLNNAMK